VSFFAVEPLLAPGGFQDVRDTLAVLHAHGFQVILDVVFNHTGESDFGGGTFSLRGLDGPSYFRMHAGQLANDAGTGNTLMLDHGPGMRLVLDAMRHWVGLGFDGFRYDLAPVMGRTAHGFTPHAPLLQAIQHDPVLKDVIHIAEPWDVGMGGYQLGHFPVGWHEWNDHYRDEVRKFWRGDGAVGALATRLAGSSDIFQKPGRKASASINFVAAHDGFSLGDAVRFATKNNFANGEDNRDGNAQEVSWVAQDASVAARCMLATLFLSRGIPMLTAGDEFGRTQGGNNNAYAQDNGVTWLNWDEADTELAEFVRGLIILRRELATFFADDFLTSKDGHWFGADGAPAQWNDGGNVVLAVGVDQRLLIAISRTGEAETFQLPQVHPGKTWKALPGFESIAQYLRVFSEV
jgi:glycogen operon protein